MNGTMAASSDRILLGPLVAAIDQGTSSTRFLVFNAKTAELLSHHQVEIQQSFPKEGWVEEDPKEILQSVYECMDRTCEKLTQLNIDISNIKAIGVTNQRETTLVWDKETGEPLYNAVVWLDLRTQSTVERLIKNTPGRNKNHLKHKTGLPISTYFSAVKLRWLMDNVEEGSVAIAGAVVRWLKDNLGIIQSSVELVKPSMPETTALGAAMAAGAAEGVSVWSLNPEDLSDVTSEKFEPQINPEESEFRYARWKKAVQRSMNWETTESFNNGNGRYTGRKLIEVGSGPTIHTVISACEHFDRIVLSDFVDQNREEVQKWIKNEEGCFDWEPIIKYVCEMEGKSSSDVEERLRQRVKQVLKCNILSENPFHPENIEPADCVITSLCLEAACKDLRSYSDALCRVAQLLRPGGVLVMVGVLGETFYYVDQVRFSCLRLSKGDVIDVIKRLNFTVHDFSIFPAQDRKNNKVSDFEAFFFLVAVKSTK
ncbi:Glycerol kinase [Bagarius yarrelli]|uniref:glycerol kinase n=1 Tax=Bagarius yarrelli TaxID=175774 RepID=A0A556TKK3_BAGYA|nr:Glycerol kinase [Bagarius yarrelli]